MRDVTLCDLLLRPADEKTTWTSNHLNLLTRRILADLGRLLPLLHDLEYSDLTYRYVSSSTGLTLRLALQPRQRNLLTNPKKGNTFEIEAARVQSEMSNLGSILRKLARGIKQIRPTAIRRETDLTLELLVRRSRKRWQLTQEGAQMELIFPDSPSELVDDDVHCIEGLVRMLSDGGSKFVQKVTLVNVDVRSSNAEATRIPAPDEIAVYVPAGVECSPHSTPRVDRPVWGERWACLARLHRCVFSGNVIGATLTGFP